MTSAGFRWATAAMLRLVPKAGFRVLGYKSYSGDTISISARYKVRPGRARPLGHAGRVGHEGRRGAAASGRRALAVTAGKAARGTVRRLGRGNGTAVPGLTALAIDRRMLGGLAAQIPRGAVLVTGTNGKGTTCRLLAGVMRASGLHPILNHEGSNQSTGLVTALLAQASPFGHLPADDQAIGLFEVDEGALPEILPQVRPAAVVFTNIFRDQMDRYLELDYLTRRWEQVLRAWPADITLVLNADDPRLACLASDLENPRVYYGIQDVAQARGSVDHTSDFPRCPRCAGELAYGCVFYAHLGHWECLALRARAPGAAGQCGEGRAHRVHVVAPAAQHARGRGGARASAARSLQRLQHGRGRGRGGRVPAPGQRAARGGAGDGGVLPHGTGDDRRTRRAPGPGQESQRVHRGAAGAARRRPAQAHAARAERPRRPPAAGRLVDLGHRLRVAARAGPGRGALRQLRDRPGRAAEVRRVARPAGRRPVTDVVVEPDPLRAFQLALARTPAGEPLWVVSTYLVLWQLRSWLRRRGYVGALWER